jgi:hypothetical protein
VKARAVAAVALVLLLSGCAPAPAASPNASSHHAASPDVAPLPAGVVVDYQLGGGYPPAPGIGGVVRDSTDDPAPGLYSVCYVNGFQTQPADRARWLADDPDLVLQRDGEPVIDENWPDELIVDTSTAEKRERIDALMAPTMEACAEKGFDAVEIDNLDSYTRSGGALSVDNAIALAALYADTAHAAGLAIAQKNAAELGARGRDDAGFDFAVAEECHRFDECGLYTDVYGDDVLDIEYTDDLRGDFGAVCADPQVPASTILRDRDLTRPGDVDYRFEACGVTQSE